MSRPTQITIDLAALRHNLQQVKNLAPKSSILAMVKSNGYGHGLTRIALTLKEADALGVACLEEGMMLREAAGLVIGGIVLGIPAALATTRLIESLLFGLQPTDPTTIAGVTLVMLTVAALAGLLPARRAAKVDPMVALRHQ